MAVAYVYVDFQSSYSRGTVITIGSRTKYRTHVYGMFTTVIGNMLNIVNMV